MLEEGVGQAVKNIVIEDYNLFVIDLATSTTVESRVHGVQLKF